MAIIAAHVPPGYFERDPYGPYFVNIFGDDHYNDYFADIVTRYSHKIMAQLYGHAHTDSFRIFRHIFDWLKYN